MGALVLNEKECKKDCIFGLKEYFAGGQLPFKLSLLILDLKSLNFLFFLII
jgi:hypothetical protein